MRRIIKVGAETDAGIEVTERSVRAGGDRQNFLFSDSSGNYLAGNLSILAEPQNIRVAGMFTFPTAYEMMIPSTTITPMPMLIPDPPIQGFTSLAQAVAQFISELI